MMILWIIYVIVVLLVFKDPPRLYSKKEKTVGVPLKRAKEIASQVASWQGSTNERETSPLLSKPTQTEKNYGSVKSPPKYTKRSLVRERNGFCSSFKLFMSNHGPLLVCVGNYFVLKLALEAFLSSVPLITRDNYNWHEMQVRTSKKKKT